MPFGVIMLLVGKNRDGYFQWIVEWYKTESHARVILALE